MPTLIFSPATCNLAETTRMIEIARASRNTFEILFTSYGGPYEHLVEKAGFTIRKMVPRLTEEKIEHIYRIDRGEERGRFFSREDLDARIDGEAALLEEIKPAAVVTGFCLSIPISTRLKKVPLVWVIGTPWIAAYYQAGLGTWPDAFDFPWLRWIPERVLHWMTNKFAVRFMGDFLKEFSEAAQRHGLPPFRGAEFWDGDYSLLAEPPEFAGVENLPKKYHFVGPLIARLDLPIPEEVMNMPRDLPIIYFAMGSSGTPEITARILAGFGDRSCRVIAPVKNLLKGLEVKVPDNVLLTSLLPAHKVNSMAQVSVIHGGVGTVMTACLAGTPIVGVGMQPEQEANLECLVRKGFAIRIRKKRVSASAVLEAVDCLLGNEEAQRKAQDFKKVLQRWDGPKNAACFLEKTFL